MNDEREDEMEENLQQVSQIVRIQKLLVHQCDLGFL